MSQTRIYVPLGRTQVASLAATRTLSGAPLTAYAVTERLERSHPGRSEEEWEYLALCAAADAAMRLRERPGDRRVVTAADVEPDWVLPPGAAGRPAEAAVTVSEPVPLRRIVSFHVDEDQTSQDDELLWYDVTELDTVAGMLA